MKHIISTLLLVVLFSAAAFAQSSESFPYHTISKGVQKLQFKDAVYTPATITTGDVTAVTSKGVAKFNVKDASTSKVRVAKTGIPSSAIQKGVARMQYEKSLR